MAQVSSRLALSSRDAKSPAFLEQATHSDSQGVRRMVGLVLINLFHENDPSPR